jgi:outer membrane murein-binding lipoprotein Lpp
VIAGLWSRFYGWILGALAVLAAVAGVYLRGRSSGKKVEQSKATKRELAAERARAQTIQEASDAQVEVSRLPDDAVRERLRDKWQRD